MTPVPFKDRLRALAAGFAREVLRVPLRFPVPLLCALAWSGLTFKTLLEWNISRQVVMYLPVALFASLAGHLLAESRGWKPWASVGTALLAAGAVGLPPWAAVGGPEWLATPHWPLVMSAAFLAAVCAPFLRRGVNDAAAWRFVASALQHAALALAIAVVAAVGLYALNGAVRALLDVRLLWVEKFIWAFSFGTGAAWIALAGIPREFDAPPGDPPRRERWVVAGLLVPLAVAYVLVVHAFAVQALVRWQLPEGRTGWMLAWFAACGVAAWLAAWPWRTQGPALLRLWGRWLPFALPVPVALLTVAALQRIGAYGVTESRYGLLLLAVWLAGLAAYGMLVRPPRLIAAPASLAALLLLAAFGPWGAGPVSTRSQLGQLEALLIAHGDFPGEATAPAQPAQPAEDIRKRIYSVAKYLRADAKQPTYRTWLERHGLTEDRTDAATWAMLMEPESLFAGKWFDLYTDDFGGGVDVTGYDTLLPLAQWDSCFKSHAFPAPGGGIGCAVEGSLLKVWRDGAPEQGVTLDLSRLNGGRRPRGSTPVVPGSRMTLESHNDALHVRLYVQRITGRQTRKGAPTVQSLTGYLLVGPPASTGR